MTTRTGAPTAVSGGPDLAQRPPRDRIMVVARELFYRHGIHSVGVEAIAEAALTNKMTLYRHFKSKDDLIVAYVTLLAEDGDAIWENISATHPDDAASRLEMWIGHVQDVLENRFERGCALANAAVELPPGHAARAVIEAYKQRKRERLVKLFRQLGYRDPVQLADEVFLLFEGARVSIQYGGKVPASRMVRMLRDVLKRMPIKGSAPSRR